MRQTIPTAQEEGKAEGSKKSVMTQQKSFMHPKMEPSNNGMYLRGKQSKHLRTLKVYMGLCKPALLKISIHGARCRKQQAVVKNYGTLVE